jgi:hypothetical protein
MQEFKISTIYNTTPLLEEEDYLLAKAERLEVSINKWSCKLNKPEEYSMEELLVFTEYLFNCTTRLLEVRNKLDGVYSSLSTFEY